MLLKKRYRDDLSETRPSHAAVLAEKGATTTRADQFKAVLEKKEENVQANDILFKHSLQLQQVEQRQTLMEQNISSL